MKQKKIMSVLEIKQADFESALNRCLDADKPDERDLELIKTVVGADIVNLPIPKEIAEAINRAFSENGKADDDRRGIGLTD